MVDSKKTSPSDTKVSAAPLGRFSELVASPTVNYREKLRQWRLRKPLIYVSRNYGRIVVPAGYVTDFASIPFWLSWLFPHDGPYLEAAIVHDYLYDHAIGTKEVADAVFEEGMRVLGVSWIRRKCIMVFVKTFGRGKYKYQK